MFTIAVISFAISFIVAGRLQDRRGPRLCAAIGAVLIGVGSFLASMATSLLFLYLAFGLIVGLANGFGYVTPIPVASKWFSDKRGLIVGLITARSSRYSPRRRRTSTERDLGMNYGLLFTAWGVAGILGPMIGARVFDTFGDYRYAFFAAAALAVLAFSSLHFARAPREQVYVSASSVTPGHSSRC